MFSEHQKTSLIFAIILVWFISPFAFVWSSTTFAQDSSAFIRRVRFIETNELDIPNPAGLSFSFRANTFHVLTGVEPARPSVTDIFLLTPTEDLVGSVRIATEIKGQINMAFDNKANRLLLINSSAKRLIELMVGSDGKLDPSALTSHKVHHFGIQNPQGMTVDPESGHLFILDATGPRLVRVEPEPDGGFDNALISKIDLQLTDVGDLRGLALDPTSGHFYVLSPIEQKLYELTLRGQVVAARDLSELDIRELQGMVFAPSGDLTDDPLEASLYIADSGPRALQVPRSSLFEGGRIVELSLIQPVR